MAEVEEAEDDVQHGQCGDHHVRGFAAHPGELGEPDVDEAEDYGDAARKPQVEGGDRLALTRQCVCVGGVFSKGGEEQQGPEDDVADGANDQQDCDDAYANGAAQSGVSHDAPLQCAGTVPAKTRVGIAPACAGVARRRLPHELGGCSVSDAPIGIFDSGFGGLTVARAVMDQLPHEQVLYVGDTARGPYGPRPIAEVREFTLEMLDELVERGVKALVIACNSASAATLRDARERYSVPVIEVVHPAARRAVVATHNNRVGVIGTQATITSQAYNDAFAAAPQVRLYSQACPRFVELVEAGITSGEEVISIAREYLAPLQAAGVDTVVLGCTHYPLLTGALSYVLGEDVTLVSSAEETALDVFRTLTAEGLLRQASLGAPEHEFLVTGDPAEFALHGRRFLGPEIGEVRAAR
ncbi:MAG: hypothetical protein RJB01_104 [Actinomycetota bacterium]